MTCTWYAVDATHVPILSDYVAFPSYAQARDAAVLLPTPRMVWGSPQADLSGDMSADYVRIQLTAVFQWTWVIQHAGSPITYAGFNFATSDLALSDAQASPELPDGFCIEASMTTCDPNELMESAKCFRCIPKRALKEVMIYLLCQWAGGLPANNPPQVSDFTFAIVGNDSIITVSENPPIGIPGFEGQFRVNGIGFWSESFSVAPGTVTQPFLPVSGFTYEAQIRWATGLGVGVSAWSPSIYFTV